MKMCGRCGKDMKCVKTDLGIVFCKHRIYAADAFACLICGATMIVVTDVEPVPDPNYRKFDTYFDTKDRKLRSRCSKCDGTGTVVVPGHSADCDGTCKNCPIPEEQPCDACTGTVGWITHGEFIVAAAEPAPYSSRDDPERRILLNRFRNEYSP